MGLKSVRFRLEGDRKNVISFIRVLGLFGVFFLEGEGGVLVFGVLVWLGM